MDEDEYVDTSDPEERAELLEFLPTRIATSSPRSRKETPRKRRKIEHLDGFNSPHTPGRTNASAELIGSPLGSLFRRGTENLSSTPQLVSIATSPTAPTVPPSFASPFTQKNSGLYEDDILVDDDYVAFSQDYRQVEPNQKVRLDDILSDMEVSNDELDVMSQATRTSQKVHGIKSTSSAVPSPSPCAVPPRTTKALLSPCLSTTKDDSDKTMIDGNLPGLTLFTQHSDDRPETGYRNERAPSPLSPLSCDEVDRGPLRPPRFTSLPPSSPIRASTSAGTPQRARTHSPENSQRQSRANDNIDADEDISQHLLEEDPAPRRYSLRDRQPRQLNPYEYDKRMYKMQLRRIPEAIVRVVSPPKKPGEHGQRHKSHEAGEDEFIAPEETEESQEQWLAKKHRRHADNNQEVDTSKSDFLKQFELSDDDLSPLPSLPSREPAASKEPAENAIRRRRKKPFPLAAKVNQIIPDPDKERPANEAHIAIGYGRRKKRNRRAESPHHRPQSMSGNSGPSQPPLPSDTRQDDDRRESLESRDVVSHAGDNIHEDVDSEFFHHDDHFDLGTWENSPKISDKPNVISPKVVTDSDAVRAGNRYRVGTTDDEREVHQESEKESNNDEDDDDDSDEEETQEEVDRKRLKVLRRMMPAFMIKKMLGPQAHLQPRPNTQRRSLSIQSPVQSSEDEGPLVPGKSKVRRRLGAGQAVPQIKGDSESSETEQVEDRKDRATISIVSSDSEAFGVESERSDADQGNVSDGNPQRDDFDDNMSNNYHSSRRGEDLIDRMLSRTRTEGVRRASRTKRRRAGHAKTGSSHTNLKKAGLDVHISASRSRTGGRQTRLPFEPVHSDNQSDTPEDYVDLAGAPEEINLDEYGVEQPKKLTKKQRREAALQKQLFTVNTGHKQVGNGRKKGFIKIDIGDEAFHAALAPVRSDKSEKPRRIYKKTVSEAKIKAIPKKTGFFKQASLHDFPHHDDGVLVDVGRMEYQDVRATHVDTVWKDDTDMHSLTRLVVDFEISPVPSGVRFGPSTYLGKHMLHDLIAFINGESEKRMPLSYSDFEGITLSQNMSTTQLSETLEIANNVLCDWIASANVKGDTEEERTGDRSRYDALMSSLTHTCVWLFDNGDEAGKKQMQAMVPDFLRRLRETIRDRLASHYGSALRLDDRMLSVLWFNVALSVRWSIVRQRAGVDGVDEWPDAVSILIEHLLGFNLQMALNTIHLAGNSINEETVLVHVAELWICLIHLLPSLSSHNNNPASPDHAFWFHVQQALGIFDTNGRPDLENSEFQWRLIFGLSALGHFTAHGIATTSSYLTASWETVAATLDSIKLIHSPTDDKLPFAALRKRDHYVRMVVARCYLLGTRWQWPMRDAYIMFNKLVEIFKSRKFGNLLGEESDFPAFLRYSNLQMLTELRKSDSAFGLFLKLVVLAGQCKADDTESAQRVNARLRKLLSLTVPLSGVPFSKDNPPLGQELSMLYNRFTSIVVAIYLEPTAANLRNRLAQARRYVTFSQADWKSRQACIRALMYASILVRHLDLPLDEPSAWLEEMVENLMRDYDNAEGELKALRNHQVSGSASESKNKAILTIQLLLGCVRKIMETNTMQPDGPVTVRYPSLILIDAPWIRRIFTKKDLTASFATRMEILKLLLSFLDARDKVIPAPQRPTLAPLTEVETQESQDEYGSFDIDFNDPDLIAALDNGGEKQNIGEDKTHDMKAAEIMDTSILPLVLRLMMQQVHDSTASVEARLEEYWLDIDKWVSCWVRCAAIVVANEKRNWSHYLNLGSQSWKIIGNSSLRRRAGLRFMLGLLLCDPSSYKEQQESYHEVLLESMVAHKVTVEHEFVSLLFSIDGLRHTMFRGVNIPRQDEQTDFKLTRTMFLELRLDIITSILGNIESCLTKCTRGELHLQYLCNRWIDFTLTMLSTMKDILENIQSDIDKANYRNFCSSVFNPIKNLPQLQSHSRLSGIIAWSATLGASA